MAFILSRNLAFECQKCGMCCRNKWQVSSKGTKKQAAYFGGKSNGKIIIIKKYNESCSFLSENLCTIHRDFGEGHLPDTCKTFPRIISDVNGTTYISLSYACPEAINIASSRFDEHRICEINTPGQIANNLFANEKLAGEREQVIKLLSNNYQLWNNLPNLESKAPISPLSFIIHLLHDFINSDSTGGRLSPRGKYLKSEFRDFILFFYKDGNLASDKINMDKIDKLNHDFQLNTILINIFTDHTFGWWLLHRLPSIELYLSFLGIYAGICYLYLISVDNIDRSSIHKIITIIETQFLHSPGFIDGIKSFQKKYPAELYSPCKFFLKLLSEDRDFM